MSIEDKYLKSVHSAFPVHQKAEKRFLNDFRSSVHEYCLQNPNITAETLTQQFGTPQKIIVDYFDNMESSIYFALIKRITYIKILVISIIIALILIIGIQAFYMHAAYEQFQNSLIASQTDTIEYIISD